MTVVSASYVGYVPFELLPWKGGTPLGERFALDYLPSFPVGLALARRRPAAELSDASDRDPISGCPHHKYTLCQVEAT